MSMQYLHFLAALHQSPQVKGGCVTVQYNDLALPPVIIHEALYGKFLKGEYQGQARRLLTAPQRQQVSQR